MQALVLAVSAILGLLLGFTEHRYVSSYPFWSGINGMNTVSRLGLIGITVTNWKLTAARGSKVWVSLKSWVKIPIILVTAFLSLMTYLFAFSVTASSDLLTMSPLYGVYSENVE